MLDFEAPQVDSPRMRRVGKALLSLALIDARNHTLRWVRACEEAAAKRADGKPGLLLDAGSPFEPFAWVLGHIGWFQEQAVARNVQRHRGAQADATAPRLASIDPSADGWFDPAQTDGGLRVTQPLPPLDAIRQYLVETLETTLELLDRSEEDDDALYFFRLALFHEDQRAEHFAMRAQAIGLDAGLVGAPANFHPREAIGFPAVNHRMGSDEVGFACANERPAHPVALPEFEIDAQPVTWAQYAQFVEDGGYDDAQWWEPRAWDRMQALGLRTPRHVDQMRQGVLVWRFGELIRAPMNQPAVHITWAEADAWCRWAGRRLPFEAEWEHAALNGESRGFRWGGVREWVAGRFRAYPNHRADAWDDGSLPAGEGWRTLRGASFATRERVRNARSRLAVSGEADHFFTGFRSCAL